MTFGDSFDLNCTRGGFPQLEVFQMTYMRVGKWKLENGAMLKLQSLIINKCKMLDDLQKELWCLSGLKKVHVTNPSNQLGCMLRNLELNNGVQLVIDEPQIVIC